MHGLLVLLLIPCLTAIGFYAMAISAARDLFEQSRHPLSTGVTPALSILKPVCGFDEGAYENLTSFCQQDYPTYQVIFGVKEPHDPAVSLIRRIIQELPHRDIELVVGIPSVGTNPKVSQLIHLHARANYPVILLSDSDIRVRPDYLRQVVAPLAHPEVGAVTALSRSVTNGWASQIEALRIATEFSPAVFVARRFEGMRFALGSTIVVKEDALRAIGGFEAIADYLADDFMLGNRIDRAGYRVVLSPLVVEHTLTTRTFTDLLHRQIRWARGIRVSRPWGYGGLLLTYGVPMSFLLVVATAGSLFAWSLLGVVSLTRMASGWIIGGHYLGDETARQWSWLVPLNDFLSFGVWCFSFLGDSIHWRGQRFRLTREGKLIPDVRLSPADPFREMAVDQESPHVGSLSR